ncbi:MAG TPA: thiamine ABC transporter substrate binding subunit [Bacillota bacterium]|nr:thiamine ABC transporter substrate binding subunit [Bacillota bacterium]HPT88580.1 thiamine ABC transporter substrate binding subunit [Bacillota bacterium]
MFSQCIRRRLFCFFILISLLSGCHSTRERTLTVYTYSSFPVKLIETVKEKFKKDYQITVDFKSFSDTGPLFNQLIRERKKPVADVVIGLDNNYFFKAEEAGLFQSYQPQGLDKVPKELIFDSQYRLVPFDYGYVVFNYDREKLKNPPASFSDLLKPEYQGKIIIMNPLTSSPGQIFLLTTVAFFGEDGYLDYWRKLKSNLLTIAPGWEEGYGMYTSGEAPIVLSYGTSPVYHLLYDNTERYQPLVLNNTAYAQIEAAGIVKGAPHLKEAKMLMDYILSTEFQELIPETQFMYPVRSDAALPESFRVAAKVDRLLNLPPEQVSKKLDKWLADWENVINE